MFVILVPLIWKRYDQFPAGMLYIIVQCVNIYQSDFVKDEKENNFPIIIIFRDKHLCQYKNHTEWVVHCLLVHYPRAVESLNLIISFVYFILNFAKNYSCSFNSIFTLSKFNQYVSFTSMNRIIWLITENIISKSQCHDNIGVQLIMAFLVLEIHQWIFTI